MLVVADVQTESLFTHIQKHLFFFSTYLLLAY